MACLGAWFPLWGAAEWIHLAEVLALVLVAWLAFRHLGLLRRRLSDAAEQIGLLRKQLAEEDLRNRRCRAVEYALVRDPHSAAAWQHVDNAFLKHQMMAHPFQNQLRRRSTGTTATGIQQAKLRQLLLVVPELNEQQHIASILDAHEARICTEEAALAKLRQVKRGLMDDLLSGRVRVATE